MATDKIDRNEEIDEAVWREFVVTRSASVRESIFTASLPFASRLAARVMREQGGADADPGDMKQWAATGLLEAIDRYDPLRQIPFRAFALRRIRGAMADGLASSSELRRQRSFKQRLRAERVRSLTRDHATSDLGEAMTALSEVIVNLALGFMLEETGLSASIDAPNRTSSAYDSLAWAETVRRVGREIDDLSDQEQTVIRLHYIEGLEFARIAPVLGLSKGRISQLHSAALTRLRRRLPRSENLQMQR